ncbi:MAG: response regulator transcription factor [Chloroflexi bacterium]|nr:response regulator transcription factor [Chloroflexota bacterium]
MSSLQRIRVMLVDDHEVVRSGLTHFISVSDNLDMVGQAANGLEALAVADCCHPDVVLMDLIMPEMDGIEAIRRLHTKYPKMHIIALTGFADHDLVQQALSAGAISFILKNTSIDELSEAIHAAYLGRPRLTLEALNVLVDQPVKNVPHASVLTPREIKVLGLIVEGCSNQQIAERLMLNLSTVKTHISNILLKLGATNRVEAVSIALREKMLEKADC